MVFQKGHKLATGRPSGSKNKYTLAKEIVLQALLDRKSELKTIDMSKILNFVASTTPKETKVEVDTPIIIKWED